MADSDDLITSLKKYLNALKSQYVRLNRILFLESGDIAGSDGKRLDIHNRMESEAVTSILNTSRVAEQYAAEYKRLQLSVNPEIEQLLEQIEILRAEAVKLGEDNISGLDKELNKLRERIEGFRMPPRPKKIYKDGDNPVRLDIKI